MNEDIAIEMVIKELKANGCEEMLNDYTTIVGMAIHVAMQLDNGVPPKEVKHIQWRHMSHENIQVLKDFANEPKKERVVYLMRDSNGFYKIGVTFNIDKRLNAIRAGGLDIDLIAHSDDNENYCALEKELHKKYKDKRIGNSEWFTLCDIEVEQVKSILIKEVEA